MRRKKNLLICPLRPLVSPPRPTDIMWKRSFFSSFIQILDFCLHKFPASPLQCTFTPEYGEHVQWFTRTMVYTYNGVHVQWCTCARVYTYNGVHVQWCTSTMVYTYNGVHVQWCTHTMVYTYNGVHVKLCTRTMVYT